LIFLNLSYQLIYIEDGEIEGSAYASDHEPSNLMELYPLFMSVYVGLCRFRVDFGFS